MRAWVYARRRNARAADAFAEEIRGSGDHVLRGNSKFYEGEVHQDAEVVYHDGLVPAIQDNHDAAGVRCEVFLDPEEPEPEASDDYHVEETRGWYKLIGPDGEQVGKSQRSEDDAWALAKEAPE